MRNAIIIGSNSDIARSLRKLLTADGWQVQGWKRGDLMSMRQFHEWDLCIIALGRIKPVGLWMDNDLFEWTEAVRSNLILPVDLLRRVWPKHRVNASVCFMAGSNPQTIMPGYSAYNASKMGMLKVVEQIDAETPDAKFFALGPGIVATKIHNATIEAKWDNPKLAAAREAKSYTPIERIYGCLKWCIEQPKHVIGGRNICASDVWDDGWLGSHLRDNPQLYKLRRVE